MNVGAFTLVLLAGFNSCIGNLALKKSRLVSDPEAGFLLNLMNPYFFLGLFFYAVNVVLFAKALDDAPVSVAYPVLAASGFAMLTLSSAWLFSEKVGLLQVAGMALIVAGIALLAQTS